ncbi:MAG TPA: selenide, water dikinase SelD [Pirellulaceae bacterium]|nr:selenide, water dikinase SelD [Pirellulaceae bacterium]
MADNHEPIRLTKMAKRAGCAAKQPPGYLLPLLAGLPPITDPNVLVGSATADDAAVYRISDDLALVLTTDFFTPIVDNAYDFGAIAAANALSDVYAMGGQPLAALSIVGFPDNLLPPSVLLEILKGAADKAQQAGIAIIGGHTIKAEEPIFGLAVVGTIKPDQVVTNHLGQAGDLLILTKPIGLGIVTTAAKNDQDRLGAISEAIRIMTTLNQDASEVLIEAGVRAMTDVTGFGLLGHLRNMVSASQVSAEVWFDEVPVIEAARQYVQEGIAPGGTHANRRFLVDWVTFNSDISKEEELLLCDAQTSGGLLAAVPAESAELALKSLHQRCHFVSAIVGRLTDSAPPRISVSRGRTS